NAGGQFDRIFEEACRVVRRAPGDGDDGRGVVLPESLAGPDEAVLARGEQMAHDRWNLLDLTAHVAGHFRSSPAAMRRRSHGRRCSGWRSCRRRRDPIRVRTYTLSPPSGKWYAHLR